MVRTSVSPFVSGGACLNSFLEDTGRFSMLNSACPASSSPSPEGADRSAGYTFSAFSSDGMNGSQWSRETICSIVNQISYGRQHYVTW